MEDSKTNYLCHYCGIDDAIVVLYMVQTLLGGPYVGRGRTSRSQPEPAEVTQFAPRGMHLIYKVRSFHSFAIRVEN